MDNPHRARTDFCEWVETIAERNRERDGSSPRAVANIVIVAPTYVGSEAGCKEADGFTLQFSAEPYVYGERAFPKDVLTGAPRDYGTPIKSSEEDPSLRSLAVDIVTTALSDYYDEHGWDSIEH